MDNKDILNTPVTDDGEASGSKTFLEFEISEQTFEAPITEEPVTVAAVDTPAEPLSDIAEPTEEFTLPKSLEIDEPVESFVETPAALRQTYIPRFTEVSDTYRMQNDPRPRPKTDTHAVKVEREEEENNISLDPTTESVDEREVEKVVVTSGSARPAELSDENLTVLKFSIPTYEEKTEESIDPVDAEIKSLEDLVAPAKTTEEPEPVEPYAEEPEAEPEQTVVIKRDEDDKAYIPDPEATFSVVEFAPQDTSETEEPLGASDSDAKQKGTGGFEFTAPIQRDSIKDRFLDTLMSIKVRLAGAILILLVMITMDCLSYCGINALDYVGLGSIASAPAVVDMEFSICIFLFTMPELVKSFALLIKGKFTPELINVISLAAIIANDLVIATSDATEYLTFGVLFGLQCVATIIASYNKTESDFSSFKIVSRNVPKNVLDKRLTRELQRENLALDGVIDEYSSKTARMFRTVFVSNFFKRIAVSCENFVNVALMLGVSVGISLVAGGVSFFLDGYSPVSGVQSMTMVFMLSLPVFSILSHKLPYRHAARAAAVEESAFVGESSIYEGADIDVFTYEDTEIFGIEDVSLRKVHLYGKAYNTPKAMKQMYALFSVVGGPLDFVFSSALDRKCPPATDIVIEDNGVSGIMEGHSICAGTEEYMISHGIAIPSDDYRTNPASADSTKIMYGAEDGEVYVKFFIRYSFSEEFTMLLPHLKEKKIVPLIYTRDPNITTDLLRVLTLGDDVIRVMKKYVPRTAEEKTYRRIDSGIVTHGDKDNAINMVLLAKKYAAFQSTLSSTELISMIVGAVLGVLLAMGDMFVLPATLLAIWQVVWCAVLDVRSRLTFQQRKEREEDTSEQ